MWTNVWPTEEGWYWTFGDFRVTNPEPRYGVVLVVRASNKHLVYLLNGVPINKPGSHYPEWVGYFYDEPMTPPECPKNPSHIGVSAYTRAAAIAHLRKHQTAFDACFGNGQYRDVDEYFSEYEYDRPDLYWGVCADLCIEPLWTFVEES